MEVFDGLRDGLAEDRSQFYKDFAVQFYGANRPGAKVSQGVLDQFWLWSMQSGLKNAYECIKAFSETDFTEDLEKFDVPTLLLHGEDDQIVPVRDSAMKSARLIKGAKDIYYPGAPHGITSTHQDQVNASCWRSCRASPGSAGGRIATMKIVVIGGTGLIGSKLGRDPPRPRPRGRGRVTHTGVNTLTGEGLTHALAGASVVVDVVELATSDDAAVLEFFETSTRNVLAAGPPPAWPITSRCPSSGPSGCRQRLLPGEASRRSG